MGLDIIVLYTLFVAILSIVYLVYNALAFFYSGRRANWYIPAMLLFAISMVELFMLLVPHGVTCVVSMNSTLSPVAKPVYTSVNGAVIIGMVLSAMANFVSLLLAYFSKR